MSSIAARSIGLDLPAAPPARAISNLKVVTPAAASTQMHPCVYRITLAIWTAFLGVSWVTFWNSAFTILMLAVCSFYALMFFGTPYVMLRQTPERMTAQKPFLAFLEQPFDTIDGPITGFQALIQVIMVPTCLTIGAIAIATIIHGARVAN